MGAPHYEAAGKKPSGEVFDLPSLGKLVSVIVIRVFNVPCVVLPCALYEVCSRQLGGMILANSGSFRILLIRCADKVVALILTQHRYALICSSYCMLLRHKFRNRKLSS